MGQGACPGRPPRAWLRPETPCPGPRSFPEGLVSDRASHLGFFISRSLDSSWPLAFAHKQLVRGPQEGVRILGAAAPNLRSHLKGPRGSGPLSGSAAPRRRPQGVQQLPSRDPTSPFLLDLLPMSALAGAAVNLRSLPVDRNTIAFSV